MRSYLVALGVSVCFAVGVASSLAADKPGIVGKWKVVSVTWYGKTSKSEVGAIYEFADKNRLAIRFPDGHALTGEYRTDAEKKPPHIDIETAEDKPQVGGGGPRAGIFSVQDDRLVLCLNGAASVPRPDKFESRKDPPTIVWSMERLKAQKQ
jgi:uncharacterized protein (TIGR03067 family)